MGLSERRAPESSNCDPPEQPLPKGGSINGKRRGKTTPVSLMALPSGGNGCLSKHLNNKHKSASLLRWCYHTVLLLSNPNKVVPGRLRRAAKPTFKPRRFLA